MDLSRLSILEVGAFDSPTWVGDEVPPRISYLDWFSSEELYGMHKDNPNRNWDRAVEVDYVIKDKHFSRHIPQRFDLTVANHVIEHVADPIAWLTELGAVTLPGGHLALAVPDRHYTFDYIRPESSVVDMVRAHEADLQKPDYWQALEAIHLLRPINAADCWPGPPPQVKLRARRFDLRESMAHAQRANREYLDVHCFVFCQHTFGELIADLHEARMIPWRLAATRGVEAEGNEFMILLAKDDPAAE